MICKQIRANWYKEQKSDKVSELSKKPNFKYITMTNGKTERICEVKNIGDYKVIRYRCIIQNAYNEKKIYFIDLFEE